jgi:acyl-[acyl-carrier-protein]-phospholipid O-acyltransferase/long-chain-fatty-acid--[acyl-carrier-protein] ligase
VSSRAFLEKVKMEVPANVVFLEDLAGKRGGLARIGDLIAALVFPPRLLLRSIGGKEVGVDDVVTVIFSSGSTGEPKGVMLTHFNIISNIQSVSQVLDMNASQRILGILPFFHATGYTGGLWAPLLTGVGAVYHVNPLDARTVGELVKRHGVTILFATPTFIHGYARRCDPGDFGSLRYVIVGAEKLTPAVAELFARRFGIEPMEGYGCTEASPMIGVNVPDYRGPGMFQVGWKRGTVGRPLPGVSVRIVDPETGAPLPAGREGMLLAKGPNIMKGYLGDPELTARVLRDGWYSTGDIALVDEDGFITITDRLSRFAKIAGEMVPIIKIEAALHEALGLTDQTFSVTSVPDPAKGERLAVIHTVPEEKLDELFEKLPRWDLPNLWVPRREAFVRVEEIPRLATGKVDLKKVREIVDSVGAQA